MAFSKQYPHLYQQSSLDYIEGDVRDFVFPPGNFSHVIHAATDTHHSIHSLALLDTLIQGTQHTLEFARHCQAEKFLLISSGAVYGKQPAHIAKLSETDLCEINPLDPSAGYAIGKLTSEQLASQYGKQYNMDIKMARCFAFVGPYLPLDKHFAIGNFIRDGLNGGPICVKSDGTNERSYLYASELMIWLWTILFSGKKMQVYNVGSDQVYSIAEVADKVAEHFHSNMEVIIQMSPSYAKPVERYLPDIRRIKEEFGLTPKVDLDTAIELTKSWYLHRIGYHYAN